MLSFSASNGIVCANIPALATVRTEVLNKAHLRLSRQTFGVCAPLARQRTTFKEDNGSNPRPIMNRKALNVGNDRTLRIDSVGLLSWSHISTQRRSATGLHE
jgi:hypothetical protein